MKFFAKMLTRWVLLFSGAYAGFAFFNDYMMPLVDIYHDMSARQVMVYAAMAILFVAWVIVCWYDSKKRRRINQELLETQEMFPMHARMPFNHPPQLLLMYTSAMADDTLRMPVINKDHAMELVYLMNLREARVGYFHKTLGTEEVLWVLDKHRALVRP